MEITITEEMRLEIINLLQSRRRVYEGSLKTSIAEGWGLDDKIRARIVAVESMIEGLNRTADKQTVVIEIRGGNVINVTGLPSGWGHNILDWDKCPNCGTLDPDCATCKPERGEG